MATHPNYILHILGMLSEYYNTEPTESQVRIYIAFLSDLEPWALKGAAYAWIGRSPFYPKVNELLQTARCIEPPQPDLLLDAGWGDTALRLDWRLAALVG